MSVPTRGETYAKLLEHIRMAEEHTATLGHLARANDHNLEADRWLELSNGFNRLQGVVTRIATKGLQ